ncbi:hypothetical protein PHLCEN_2v10735 [Hermanssonia centrifuga]|uniref:Uncharacterized protein n=1 Tax=Hermanssonia centrifuga TaxID=98765 RepID=A0A2R6NM32_9APHY|nr:hypothetical protein PHLCEN_2v10735 [Hermanssonia centrifuga]
MAYQYGVGGTSPMAPHMSPMQRSHTPVMPPPQQAQIQPGSITYTTTTGPDGQLVYHPFNYQTPQGIVSGIQWIPAEATSVAPLGATPANEEFRSSFSRSDDRAWQLEEDRRRRKDEEREQRREEKEIAREIRRAREREDREFQKAANRNSGYGYDALDRRFGDMDLKDGAREYEKGGNRSRRNSTYGTTPAPYPGGGGAYGAGVYAGAGQPYSTGAYGSAGPQRPVSPYQTGAAPRPVSPYQAPIAPRPISPYANPGMIPRAPSPYAHPGSGIGRAPSPYAQPGAGIGRAPSPYAQSGAGIGRAASPYQVPIAPRPVSPYAQPTAGGTYPPGHVMEGRPVLPRSLSRAASPVPGYATSGAGGQYSYATAGGGYPTSAQPAYGSGGTQYPVAPYPGASPVMPIGEQQQPMLSAPEGFSRPPNLAHPYTRFEVFKIQDMDDFYENIPKMPLVLQPHDVYHEDWMRLMTDLALAWSGKLPVPEYAQDGRPPKRTVLTSDLIDLWNASFFLRRGAEVVLFKGRERRSGRNVGTVELHLPGFENITGLSDSSDSEEEDSDDADDDDRYRYGAYGGVYGRQAGSQLAELQEAKRIRREQKKAEKKRRRQEKKQRRKQKEAEKTYALYVTCVPREV